MKQDYPKIRRAGAELVAICPDSWEDHCRYGLEFFGEELPYLFAPDPGGEIARTYGLLHAEEHPHGGFYYRSLWLVDATGIIRHKTLPWDPRTRVEDYQELFTLIGSEPGEWRPTQGLFSVAHG